MAITIKVYLLELTHGKFYVGQASNVRFRFQEHIKGTGAKWTRLYKPVKIRKEQEVLVNSPGEAMLYENWSTLQAMERFGWQNVRGGEFLVVEEYQLLQRIEHIYDLKQNKIKYYVDDLRRYVFGNSEHWLIYVLELCNGRYYIGSCKHLGKALGEHFCGKGISWTKDNPVSRVSKVICVTPDLGSYLVLKDDLLISYISLYGWDNVRGGKMPAR